MKLSLTPALGFSTAPSARPETEGATITVVRSRPKGRKRVIAKAVRPVSVPIVVSDVA